jgi:hypothetical protein
VHAFVGLRTKLTVDSGEMRDRLTTGEGSTERVGVIGRRRNEGRASAEDRRVALVDTASDEDDLVPV